MEKWIRRNLVKLRLNFLLVCLKRTVGENKIRLVEV